MPRQVALPPTLRPRIISREAAAAYVNVSPNTFDLMVRNGVMPSPKKLWGHRKGWDVQALDAAADNLTVEEQQQDDGWNDDAS
jgi:predicted DNA-binding transcriptional regulator AlpA